MSKTYQKKQVKCIKCGKLGTLSLKTSITKGVKRKYYYVQHTDLESYKKSWCYLGSYEKLPTEYQNLIHNNYTQQKEVIHNSENPKTNTNSEKNSSKTSNSSFHKHFKSPISLIVSNPRRHSIWLLTSYGQKSTAPKA